MKERLADQTGGILRDITLVIPSRTPLTVIPSRTPLTVIPSERSESRDLFHTAFYGFDGVGVAILPNGVAVNRFSLLPEGSLLPPSSQSCGGCHNFPFPGAAGVAQTHVFNDPDVDGNPPFNQRSTTSLFGDDLLQLLGQEITEELHSIRDLAALEGIDPALPDPREAAGR